jgi:hypothetical protein
MYHDLYIGDGQPQDRQTDFDMNLTTGQLIARIAEAIDGEQHGYELTIVVRSHRTKKRNLVTAHY